VKPPPFDYVVPDTLQGVLEALDGGGPDAKLLAGGQSLIPLLNFRLIRPSLLIDLRRVPELRGIELRDGDLDIGAMTRQREIEHDPLVMRYAPLFRESTRLIGHLPIRTRGTLGGSLAHGDPAAEYPVAALAADLRFLIQGKAGSREIAARDFFLGYLTTALEPDEVLVRVRIPHQPARRGTAFVELARRPGDFAIVAVAATVTLDPEARIESATVAVGGAAPAPFRADAAEAALAGARIGPELLEHAAGLVADAAQPDADLHATAEYRRALCRVLAGRALAQAAARAAEQATEAAA
jgi:aerobic carbon-monoxide dehydrogenase medium subunit